MIVKGTTAKVYLKKYRLIVIMQCWNKEQTAMCNPTLSQASMSAMNNLTKYLPRVF